MPEGDAASDAIQVQVQVCGRQEALQLARAGIRELAIQVERCFEVRPPFLFMDRAGKHLQDDEALTACVATGGLVVVRLTEGVLHDLSRRVDQLRHLQWGFFTDQMTAARQERIHQYGDMKKLHASMEQGMGTRESLLREWQKSIDGCHDLIRKEKALRDEVVRGVADRVAELQQGTQLGFEARDMELNTTQRRLEDLSQAFDVERREREQECEELKMATERLQRDMSSQKSATDAPQGALRTDVAELRQQVGELRQALGAEQRDRATVALEAREAVTEIQRSIDQEVMDRQGETQDLMTSLQDLEGNMSVSLHDMRQAISELTKRVATISDTYQQERMQRQQESNDLTRQLETTRRILERDSQERERLAASVTKLSEDWSKRIEDEVAVREMEVGRIARLIAEESNERHESHRQLSRTISEFEKGGNESTESRTKDLRELQRMVLDVQKGLDAEKMSRLAQYKALEESHYEHCRAISEESRMHVSYEDHQNLKVDLNTVKELVKGLGEIREDLEAAKTGSSVEAACQMIREECEQTIGKAFDDFEHEVRKELGNYAEAIAKLRVDCKEAMHREVRSRQENDTALQEAIEQESKARVDSVQALDKLITEVRQGLLSGSVRLSLHHSTSPVVLSSQGQSPVPSHLPPSPSPQSSPTVFQREPIAANSAASRLSFSNLHLTSQGLEQEKGADLATKVASGQASASGPTVQLATSPQMGTRTCGHTA